MIPYALFSMLFSFVTLFTLPLTILPDVSIPSQIATNIATAGSYIAVLDNIFPVGALLTIIGAFITVETAYFVYKLIKWGYSKIPGVS